MRQAELNSGPARKVLVYNDGNCPFCRWAQAAMSRHDRNNSLGFRDFNQPGVPESTPFTFAEHHQLMRARDPSGQWHTGYFAWIAVLDALPRWRPLARIMRLPPFRWVGPSLYGLIARNRYRVPHFFLRWFGAPTPCDQTCPQPQPSAPVK